MIQTKVSLELRQIANLFLEIKKGPALLLAFFIRFVGGFDVNGMISKT